MIDHSEQLVHQISTVLVWNYFLFIDLTHFLLLQHSVGAVSLEASEPYPYILVRIFCILSQIFCVLRRERESLGCSLHVCHFHSKYFQNIEVKFNKMFLE